LVKRVNILLPNQQPDGYFVDFTQIWESLTSIHTGPSVRQIMPDAKIGYKDFCCELLVPFHGINISAEISQEALPVC
jgi:hypothetical protein